MKITENFDRREFACHCNCGYDSIHTGIVHRLQVIRDIVKVPIKIHSGCRCRTYNKKVGGKPESYHILGDAIDWSVIAEELQKGHLHIMLSEMLKEWSGGFHYYIDGDFFHCDIGPSKRRW